MEMTRAADHHAENNDHEWSRDGQQVPFTAASNFFFMKSAIFLTWRPCARPCSSDAII